MRLIKDKHSQVLGLPEDLYSPNRMVRISQGISLVNKMAGPHGRVLK